MMRCRFCGSTALQPDSQHKNFSTGKAVAGTVTFGMIGAAAGFIGKEVAGYRCGACGSFMAEPMDGFLEMQIDNAIRDAESGRDASMFRYYQEQFPNLHARIPAAQPVAAESVKERPVTQQKDEESSAVIKRSYEPGVWQPTCPVFVEAISLLTQNNEDHLSLSVSNISDKTVRSAYFQAVVYDDTGDEVTRRQCVFQGMEVPGGAAPLQQKRFPDEKTFPLGTDIAYRVDLWCEKVAFADSSVWRAEETQEPVSLPVQPILSAETFPRFRYLKSRLLDDSESAEVRMPLDAGDFWLCDCGHPAMKDAPCPFCGDTLSALQDAFSQKVLEKAQVAAVKERAAGRAAAMQNLYNSAEENDKKETYQKALKQERKNTVKGLNAAIALWEQIPGYSDADEHLLHCRSILPETAEREEAERVEAEKAKRIAEEKAEAERREAKEAARKKRVRIIIIASIAAVMVALAAILIPILRSRSALNASYRQAVELLENEQYAQAYDIFEGLGDYKDSADKAKEARKKQEQKRLETEQAMLQYRYEEALGFLIGQDYPSAIKAFEGLESYKNSKEKLLEAQEAYYKLGLEKKAEGDYKSALEIFKFLGDYEDSKDVAAEIRKLLDAGKAGGSGAANQNGNNTSGSVDTGAVVDAANYFYSPGNLVSQLGLSSISPWQFGGSAYAKNGFKLEYGSDSGMFSMLNQGNQNVRLYGVSLYSPASSLRSALIANGWRQIAEGYDGYGIRMGGSSYVIDLYCGSDDSLTGWYINNWPQGDYGDFFDQF